MVRNTLWMVVITVIQSAGMLTLLAISARLLEPVDFGALAIIIALSGLFHGLIRVPNYDVITTYIPRGMARGTFATAAATLRMAFVVAQGLAVLAYVFLAVCILAGYRLVGLEHSHVPAALVYGLVGFFNATFHECLAALRLAGCLYLALISVLVGALVQITALLTAWWWGGDLLIVVLSVLAGTAISSGGLFVTTVFSSGYRDLPGFSGGKISCLPRDIFRFQMLSLAQGMVSTLHMNLPVILLGALTSSVHSGVYRAAYYIVSFMLVPLSPVSQSVHTEYSQRWYFDGSFGRVPQRSTLLLTGFAVVGFGFLLLFHSWIIRVVLGPGYEHVSGPLLALIPGACISTCITTLHVLPLAMGQVGPLLMWKLVALVAQLLMLLLFLPQYQALGAAWSYTTFHFVFATMVIFFAARTLRQCRR